MKVVVIRTNLRDGLNAIEAAAGENQALPILRNALIEASEGKLKLATTNLEIGASYTVAGKVLEDGRATAPIATLLGIMNNIQSDRLNLESKGASVEITSDNYHATLQGMPAEDFPLIPKVKNQTEYVSVKSEILKESLAQVVLATQTSDLRPELNSVLFDFSIDTLRFAATDSFRLAEKVLAVTEIESTCEEGFRVLVPLKTVHEILRVLRGDELVKVFRDENQVLFKTNQFELISRLLEGNFPDYGAIVPKKFGAEILVERQEFVNALKLASVFGNKSNEVKILVPPGKKALQVSSADQAVGENSYLLPAKVEGKLGETVFNWRYLLDALKAVKTGEVFFGVNDEGQPALLRGAKEGSYFYILKPILKA
ncbi:DNA polymerase III subunit beta [Candidatus Parcubacteria bacterium]|nr:MAG: DNA polymerase III subunit beta [Candidatus Parcubacteria bacterium]